MSGGRGEEGRGEGGVGEGHPAASDGSEPKARDAHGGPGVAPNLPTAIVTVVPGGCCVPPGGSCVCTIPSWLWSVTGWLTIFTPKPEALSVACASFCVSVVTSGTVEVVGPFDTMTVIVVPGGWSVPGPGLVLTTVSFGASDFTSLRKTANPLPRRIEFAESNVEPTTFGTAIGFGPFETLRLTCVPCFTDKPAVGDCEITCPWGLSDSVGMALPFSFASWRSDSALSSGSPTTLGTSVLGGPSET